MTKRNRILLATRNKGKIAELGELLADFKLEVAGLDSFPALEDVEETGVTFQENALLKAAYAAEKTGLVAVADDSGLIVEALGGAPGVYSARYCLNECPGLAAGAAHGSAEMDKANIRCLLEKMRAIPESRRQASFCSVVAAVAPGGKSITAEGLWPGLLLEEARGANGFGYDPVFLDPELGRSAAELTREEKNARSHRGRALRSLRLLWPEFWSDFTAGV